MEEQATRPCPRSNRRELSTPVDGWEEWNRNSVERRRILEFAQHTARSLLSMDRNNPGLRLVWSFEMDR